VQGKIFIFGKIFEATCMITMHTTISTSTAHLETNVATFSRCGKSFPPSGYDICKRTLENEIPNDSSIHSPIMNRC